MCRKRSVSSSMRLPKTCDAGVPPVRRNPGHAARSGERRSLGICRPCPVARRGRRYRPRDDGRGRRARRCASSALAPRRASRTSSASGGRRSSSRGRRRPSSPRSNAAAPAPPDVTLPRRSSPPRSCGPPSRGPSESRARGVLSVMRMGRFVRTSRRTSAISWPGSRRMGGPRPSASTLRRSRDGRGARRVVAGRGGARVDDHAGREAVARRCVLPAPEAEQAARNAVSLVAAGGERGPALERRNPPWSVLLGEEAAGRSPGPAATNSSRPPPSSHDRRARRAPCRPRA